MRCSGGTAIARAVRRDSCGNLPPNPGLPPPDRSWDSVRERGTLRVGMDFGRPPFAYTAPDGQLVGLNVDLARDLAARLGVRVEIVNVSADGFYDAVRVGRIDILVSTLPPTPAFRDIALSAPYVEIGERVIVRAGSMLRTPDDLAGRRVGAELGSDGDLALRVFARRVPLVRDSDYDTGDAALAALRAGSLDAVIADGIAARRAVAADPGLALLPLPVREQPFVWATKRTAVSLTMRTDRALAAARTDGTLARLDARWLAVPVGNRTSLPSPLAWRGEGGEGRRPSLPDAVETTGVFGPEFALRVVLRGAR